MDMIRIDCREISGDDIGKSEQIQRAYDCFVKHGYAILDHAISEEKIRAVGEEFNSRYTDYLVNRERDDTLKVGNQRFMVPVEFSGGFADPDVYGNRFACALVREVLDDDAILDNFGAIVSLSGAELQHFHRDARSLFSSEISAVLPAHAMTVIVPLVEMNGEHGTTEIWPGSHRWRAIQKPEVAPPSLSPTVPVGSVIMWDYRLFHRGTPNVSSRHRSVIYGTYARRWYQDVDNFDKSGQRRLWLGDDFIQSVPEDRRPLFARVG